MRRRRQASGSSSLSLESGCWRAGENGPIALTHRRRRTIQRDIVGWLMRAPRIRCGAHANRSSAPAFLGERQQKIGRAAIAAPCSAARQIQLPFRAPESARSTCFGGLGFSCGRFQLESEMIRRKTMISPRSLSMWANHIDPSGQPAGQPASRHDPSEPPVACAINLAAAAENAPPPPTSSRANHRRLRSRANQSPAIVGGACK